MGKYYYKRRYYYNNIYDEKKIIAAIAFLITFFIWVKYGKAIDKSREQMVNFLNQYKYIIGIILILIIAIIIVLIFKNIVKDFIQYIRQKQRDKITNS